MPPKKNTMDKLKKKSDEKLTSFKFDLVSDLKKEIMNEVRSLLSEKRQGNRRFEVTSYFLAESCGYSEACP